MSQITQDPALQVVSINDFSSGIHQYGRRAYYAVPAVNAPLGSAFTCYNCINEPGVGLVPLPSSSANVSYSSWPVTIYNGRTVTITDIECLGPYGQTRYNPVGPTPDTLYFGYGYYHLAPSATNSYVQGVAKMSVWSGATGFYTATNGYLVGSLNNFGFTASGVNLSKTRYNYTDASNNVYSVPAIIAVGRLTGSTTEGSTALVGPWQNADTTAQDFHDIGFPNLLFPSPKGPFCYFALTHEFRIIFFTQVSEYYDGANTTTYSLMLTNEDIYYTDPPGTFDFLTLSDFPIPNFDVESVNGWGAWGSVSTGELFLVRNAGGGLVISGDVAVPGVTKLPAVNGTGGIFQKAPVTPAGMLYLSEYDGAYSWNGGNTSSKISNSIPDDALQRPDYKSIGTGPNAQNVSWGNWAMFANNYLYDTSQNSWWQIDNPNSNQITVWGNSSSSRYVWGTDGQIQSSGGTATAKFYCYDKETQVGSWYWESNPIPVTIGNLVNVEFVEIVASNPTPTACTFEISFTSVVGDPNITSSVSFTVPPLYAGIRLSQRIGVSGYNIQVSIVAANSTLTNPGPTLHSIDLGYNISTPTSTT